jgi:hypothetical protein
MQTRDEALAEIAATILDLETLATRNSDRLDFHELSVWGIKAALESAYAAGRAGAQLTNGGEAAGREAK